jgi:hypothetical protein
MFFLVARRQPGKIRAPGICGKQQVYRVMIGKGCSVLVLAALSADSSGKPQLQLFHRDCARNKFFYSWLRKG